MRTKTLLLTAALSAAGVATSMAQVYSVNAVGYVNTTLTEGLNLISNPLIAADNKISSLITGQPNGTVVYRFADGAFQSATWLAALSRWNPPEVVANETLPGEGIFVRLPAGSPNLTITFVGEVPQGDLKNPLPVGLSIKSSMVPQAGDPSAAVSAGGLGMPPENGAVYYAWNETTQAYESSTYLAALSRWNPALKPLAVGEAFFLRRVTAGSWDRNFSVNQ
jgi:hypothetical protein